MYTSHEDIRYNFEDDPKEQKALKAHPDIDGGWAWMVVLASFFVHILVMGSQMALGVLNMEWLEEFHQSRGLTAWVSSLSMGTTLIVGPFIGLFISTCGCRRTAIVGGLVHSLGWVLSASAASVNYLLITFGLAAGLGSGMVYLPAVVMVGRYFQKRRALAQGLSTTGTGFGTFLMTALLKYLCAEYGWRNAMFIQGAVALNLCVCGALMRPLAAGPGRAAAVPGRKEAEALPAAPLDSVQARGGGPAGAEEKEEGEEVPRVVEEAPAGQEQARPPRNVWAGWALKGLSRLPLRLKRGFQDWHAGYFGAASLFTNRAFVAFVVWALFAYSSFVIPFIHLPEIVKLYHLSAQNDAFPLTSVIAIVHIAGKVVLGLVADLPSVRAWNVFLLANLTLVLSVFLLPLMRTYAGLATVCALIGFASGYFSLMPVVTEDLVGSEHLANAYGIIICANGVSALLGPPFAGWIFDITQKYDFSFYICGLLYLIGILFLLIQPCIQVVRQSRKKYTDGVRV